MTIPGNWTILWTAPVDEHITPYDEHHFLTYARLLDATAAEIDWQEGARSILLIDVERYADLARRCWNSHLARAHWIATRGYELALFQAGLRNPD